MTDTSTQPAAVKRQLPVIPIAIGAVAIAVAAWYFGFRGSRAPALTNKDTILVADFVNKTGDAVFDDGLRQGVAVLLQQSPFFTLLSDQRVQRTLRQMQRPVDELVIGDAAREACKRTGGTATVEGTIATAASGLIITLEAHNCQTGKLIARSRAETSTKANVLDKLSEAVSLLRAPVGEPDGMRAKYNASITSGVTASVEALHAYGQGVRTRATHGEEPSMPLFRQAIDKDPAFALAYAKLGVVTGNLNQTDVSREGARKAFEHRDRATEYERLYINWNYAARVQQDDKATKDALEQLTTTYPRDFAGRNNYGVYFNNKGDYDEALKQYRAATDIAPDEPGPISNAAYVQMAQNKLDAAFTDVDRALALRPDPSLAIAAWVAARVAGHPRATALEQLARKLAPTERVDLTEASIAAWEGRFKDYGQLLDAVDARARAAGNTDLAKNALIARRVTLALYLQGRELDALAAQIPGETDPFLVAQYVGILVFLGEDRPARNIVPKLLKTPAAASPQIIVTQAYLTAKDGKNAAAIALLQPAIAQNPRAPELLAVMADIRAKSGDVEEAIAGYRRVIAAAGLTNLSPTVPDARLKLARLLLTRGDIAGGKEQLDTLLAQWKNADTQFPMLTEAKALRARIQ